MLVTSEILQLSESYIRCWSDVGYIRDSSIALDLKHASKCKLCNCNFLFQALSYDASASGNLQIVELTQNSRWTKLSLRLRYINGSLRGVNAWGSLVCFSLRRSCSLSLLCTSFLFRSAIFLSFSPASLASIFAWKQTLRSFKGLYFALP